MSKLAITLSSPSPQAAKHLRLAKPLFTPGQTGPPPPLHDTNNGPLATMARTTDGRANDLAETAAAAPQVDTGGTGSGNKSSKCADFRCMMILRSRFFREQFSGGCPLRKLQAICFSMIWVNVTICALSFSLKCGKFFSVKLGVAFLCESSPWSLA